MACRHSSASGLSVELGTRWNDVREVVLVEEDSIVRRLARSKLPSMAVEIKAKVSWSDDARVNDRARGAIPAAVGVRIGGGEEEGLVAPANDDERDGRAEAQFHACSWTVAINWCVRKAGKGGRTSDQGQLFGDDGHEFAFGDAVLGRG